jgi:DNA-binding response OmpR family regulator
MTLTEDMNKSFVKGKVLLVDGAGPIVKFLNLNMVRSGYEVVLAHDVAQALALLPELKGVQLVALASLEAVNAKGLLGRLRRELDCPVLVYGVGFFSDDEINSVNADAWIDRFYEPEEFLKTVEETMSRRPGCKPENN